MTQQKRGLQKAAAVSISVLFHIGVFMLLFRLSFGLDGFWPFFWTPVVAAVYFVLAGNLFSRRLGLSRWLLWAAMNVIGGLGGWILLAASFPLILFNGFVLFLLIPAAVISAIVWGVVGIGFWCVYFFKRRSDGGGTL